MPLRPSRVYPVPVLGQVSGLRHRQQVCARDARAWVAKAERYSPSSGVLTVTGGALSDMDTLGFEYQYDLASGSSLSL